MSEEIGFSKNKSLSISSLKIKNKYFFDFVRGVWDGDGTIYCSKDLRWKNRYIVSIGFASGSLKFLEWLRRNINSRIGVTGHIHKGARVFQLKYARRDSKSYLMLCCMWKICLTCIENLQKLKKYLK